MATICTEQNRSVFDVHPELPNEVMAAPVPLLARLSSYGHRFLQWVELRREQQESRDAFRHLLKLDDNLLQDIGVTRADVERAAKLPLAEDAAQVLYEATGKYRSNRV